jgi:hypothetical protein
MIWHDAYRRRLGLEIPDSRLPHGASLLQGHLSIGEDVVVRASSRGIERHCSNQTGRAWPLPPAYAFPLGPEQI